MLTMQELLEKSSERHKHLCPRQVLGVRMGMMAAQFLKFELPQPKKRLLTIVETDGCFADGVEVATGCTVGHRTLRVQDFGKVAAVFIDTKTKEAFRIAPKLDVRKIADLFGAEGKNRWERQLLGYQRMPIDRLFSFEWVTLRVPVEEIVSRPGVRVNCDLCGEEIINQREVQFDSRILCQACAGYSYYLPVAIQIELNVPINV
jgi:formylmethanofuran dehydrogenase subunit E